ncbi:MAG: alpha/beta fold hydrolase, partial [Caldimonas sp.]
MQLTANGIRLEVEDHGSPAGEPLLLVMGLGMQLLGWHEDLVAQLVARGFRVIRYDNRDIGLSQGFDHLGVPSLAMATLRHALGMRVKSPYKLADMAADAVGVLDALGIPSAHVWGVSMGGMIAQHMATMAPTRVKSLTLTMTSSGARHLPAAPMKVRSALMARPKVKSVDGIVDHYVK